MVMPIFSFCVAPRKRSSPCKRRTSGLAWRSVQAGVGEGLRRAGTVVEDARAFLFILSIRCHKQAINAAAGFTRVVEAIRACGRPAVGHNCMFDVSYVLAACVEPRLPATWPQYKKLVGEVRWSRKISFELITQVMNESAMRKLDPRRPCPSHKHTQWFRGGVYDTKYLSRRLPEVFEGWTSLGDVYKAVTIEGGERRAKALAVLAVAAPSAGRPLSLPTVKHAAGFEKYLEVGTTRGRTG